MIERKKKTNRLADESSPYLLQHATNPVDWFPWGPAAFAKAAEQDKPILLSIGYSSCHWCHVMAHESFENEEIAAIMNEHFVCVKVDREERPDLDRVYQTTHQLLAQRAGGWPLTLFLTPDDKMPFYAGTYFPPEPRSGLPAFGTLLEHIARVWREQGDEVRRQNLSLREALASLEPPPPRTELRLDGKPLVAGGIRLEQDFDPRYGGFGTAPKFPHPATLEHMLRDPAPSPPTRMALFTLERMSDGGLYDHVGGGFSRYCVDDAWQIPHFEKMLYDNGPLLGLYAHAYARTGDERHREVVEETFAFMERELYAPNGAWCAALDADSEGHEGRYYVWTLAEVRQVVGMDAFRTLAARFGLDAPPNFEDRWHLTVRRPLTTLAKQLDESPETIRHHLENSLAKLRNARAQRVAPGRDDKVLAAWNALAIRGLAQAGRLLGDGGMIAAATRALDAIAADLMPNGRLMASWKDGAAKHPAYLDDHAFLADAAVELLMARWRRKDLDLAVALCDEMLARFAAPDGGFFFTSEGHEALAIRPRQFSDEALPSGNGVAARVLQRLGWLLGEPRYLDAAQRTLRAAWQFMDKHPHAHPTLLSVLADTLEPPRLVVLRGRGNDVAPFQAILASKPRVGELVFTIPADAEDLPPVLATKAATAKATAYVCRGTVCGPPLTQPDHLLL